MAINIGDAILKLKLDKGSFDKDMAGIGGFIEKHRKGIAAGIAGFSALAVGGAIASMKAFADTGGALFDMSKKTGFGVQALSELKYAAEQSGTSLSGLQVGVRTLSGAIVDAEDGLETYTRAFDRIGINVKTLKGLRTEEQFMKVAMAVADLKDETLRMATAQDLFGRAGTELLPLLSEGADGIKKLREEAHELGVVFDEETAASAKRLQDTLTRFNKQLEGIKFTVAEGLLPNFEWWSNMLTRNDSELRNWIRTALDWSWVQEEAIARGKAWQSVMAERTKFMAGEANELQKALDLLESMLKSQGLLNEQAQETISLLRGEIKSRKENEQAVKNETAALDKLNKEKADTLKIIEKTIRGYEYEKSAIGELNIGIDDIIWAARLLGQTNEEITQTIMDLGDEKADTLRVFEAFGFTVEQVAEALGIETEEIRKLKEANQELEDANRSLDESFQRLIDQIRYEDSAAGELRITMYDIYDAMDELGWKAEDIKEKFALWGTDISSVEMALQELGLTAEQVDKLITRVTAKKGISRSEASGLIARTYAQWQSEGGYAPWYTPGEVAEDIKRAGGGMQYGGIIQEPTLLTSLRSMRPYAVAGERGAELVSPVKAGITNTFNISQLVVREEADLDRISRKLYRMQKMGARGVGIV